MPRSSQYAGAMTPRQFTAAVARHPKLQAEAIAVARSVLVDGLSLAEAGRRHQVQRQRAHELVRLLNPVRPPKEWVRRWVSLPSELMDTVIAMEREALRALPDPSADTDD